MACNDRGPPLKATRIRAPSRLITAFSLSASAPSRACSSFSGLAARTALRRSTGVVKLVTIGISTIAA